MTPFLPARVTSASVSLGLLLASLGFLGVACGDDETAAPQGVPIEEYTSAYKGAVCEYLVRCHFFPDQATCDANTVNDRGVVQAVAAVSAGVLTYDADAARSCIDAIGAEDCYSNVVLPRDLRQKCDGVFGGRKGEGEPCFQAIECEGVDALCEGSCTDSCCQGTCVLAAAAVPVGDACDQATTCEDGSYCQLDDMGVGVCAEKVGPGEVCDSENACVEGYACDPSSAKCFKQALSGAQCNPDLAADGCAALSEYCHPEDRKCVAQPGPGEPCAVNALYVDGVCAPYAQCRDGVCELRPTKDQPCTGGYCIQPAEYGLPAALFCGDMDTCVSVTPPPVCVQ